MNIPTLRRLLFVPVLFLPILLKAGDAHYVVLADDAGISVSDPAVRC